jgi:probable rRNA maturation factor
MAKSVLTINQTSASWSRFPNLKTRLGQAARMTLDHLPKRLRFPARVTLLLTSDAAVRRLNRDFRGIDKPTNVLSFPQYGRTELRRLTGLKQPVEMGDIAIAYQYIVGEAKRDNKILINHLTHLFIHGLLHLFGYDHGLDPEAARMERLETKIMAALGLPDPYRAVSAKEPKRARTAGTKRSAARCPKK